MGGGALSFTRRRWLHAASGAAALAFSGGAAWWWRHHAHTLEAPDEAGLSDWLEELTRSGRAAWWDSAQGGGPRRGHTVRDTLRQAGQSAFQADRTKRCQVLVVGGGIAGLSAAYALRQAGMSDVALLELEDSPGGNSRGMSVGAGTPLPCPMGAHYLPLPGPQALEVRALLQEWGLVQPQGQGLGLTPLGETHLCHSPQERVYWQGAWFDGLMPPLAGREAAALNEQGQRLAQWMSGLSAQLGFAMPCARAPWTAEHANWEAQTFAQALDTLGIQHPVLRAHLDYCCHDDYGAGAAQVSAWAGVHYFASRHGFRWGGTTGPEREERGVFTWPQGNGWLVQRFTEGLKGVLHPRSAAVRIRTQKHGVEVDALHWPLQASDASDAAGAAVAPERVRWQAERVILATPLFISQRLLEGEAELSQALAQSVSQMRWAPWLLTQLQLDAPLADRGGAPPSWDNILATPLQGSAASGPGSPAPAAQRLSLGYVDATHQSLSPMPGPTVLTHYQALGGNSLQELTQARRELLHQSATHWLRGVLREVSAPHPDLRQRLQSATLVRHGHAMSVPVPGLRSLSAFQALGHAGNRVRLAHSDLAGYSVFEEACYWGMRAAAWAQNPAQARWG